MHIAIASRSSPPTAICSLYKTDASQYNLTQLSNKIN